MGLPAVSEYLDLGLEPPRCSHWLSRRNRPCGQPAIADTALCVYHGGADLVAADISMTVAEARKEMAAAIVPVAMQRLWDIIMDEEAAYPDVIRAAFGIMDRVGLGPVQGLQIDANVRTEAPLQAIQALLSRVAERLPQEEDEEIIDAEILD